MPNDSQELAVMGADAVLPRLRAALGVQQDTELAAILQVPYSTLTSWKRRGSVPLDNVAEICLKKGLSLDWIYLERTVLPNEANSEASMALLRQAAEYALTFYKINPSDLNGFGKVVEHMYASVQITARNIQKSKSISFEDAVKEVEKDRDRSVSTLLAAMP